MLTSYAPEDLRHLLELQRLDSEIDAQQAALDLALGGSELAQFQAALDQAQAAQDELEASLNTIRRDLRYQEQEVAALRTEIVAQERRLYGGAVRNPKEASQLEQHVAGLRRRMGDLEDRAVSLMLEVESSEPGLIEACARTAAARTALSEQEALLADRRLKLGAHLPELRERRSQAQSLVPPSLFKQYEVLLPRRAGVAVAALVDGKCSGCRMTVPFVTVREVRHGALRTCDTCGRIIVEA